MDISPSNCNSTMPRNAAAEPAPEDTREQRFWMYSGLLRCSSESAQHPPGSLEDTVAAATAWAAYRSRGSCGAIRGTTDARYKRGIGRDLVFGTILAQKLADARTMARFRIASDRLVISQRHRYGEVHVQAINYDDRGGGGISGVCNVYVRTVLALFLRNSPIPLWFDFCYDASGYNDDPTSELEISCSPRFPSVRLTREPEEDSWPLLDPRPFRTPFFGLHGLKRTPLTMHGPFVGANGTLEIPLMLVNPNDAKKAACSPAYRRVLELVGDENLRGLHRSLKAESFIDWIACLGEGVRLLDEQPSGMVDYELRKFKFRQQDEEMLGPAENSSGKTDEEEPAQKRSRHIYF
jgi:hypothetical protein